MTPQIATVLVAVLADIGDALLSAEDEQSEGLISMPDRWRLMGVINHLLKHAADNNRLDLIKHMVAQSRSIALAADLVETVEELRAKPENAHAWALSVVDDALLAQLKENLVQRLRALSREELLAMPELDFIIHRWMRWDDPQEVIGHVRPLFESDESLPRVLEKHLRFGTRHVSGDRAVSRVPLLNPKLLEPLIDISALEPRVRALLERRDLTTNQRAAAEQYLWAMGRIHEGKDPGSMRDID